MTKSRTARQSSAGPLPSSVIPSQFHHPGSNPSGEMGGCFGRTNLIPARTQREPERWDWVLSQRFRPGSRPQTSLRSSSSRRGTAGAFRLGPGRVSLPIRHLWSDAKREVGVTRVHGAWTKPWWSPGRNRMGTAYVTNQALNKKMAQR